MTVEEDVRRTLAIYPKFVDDRNADGYASLFTDKGRVQTRAGVFVGRDSIRNFFVELYKAQPADRIFKHLFGNSVITVDGDKAVAECDMLVFECLNESSWQIYTVVRHHDRLEKQPSGDWLFSEAAMEEVVYLRTHYTPPYEV